MGATFAASGFSLAVHALALDPASVTSEANPSTPAQPHSADVFYRLFGDIDGNALVDSANDYPQFVTAFDGYYNPAFDYDANGGIATLDYGRFKHDLGLTYTGLVNFNPAALRPANVSASVNGPTSLTLSWTGPAAPSVTGYTIQRWSAADGAWVTVATGLPSTAGSYTDETALPGNTYEYRVLADAGSLASDWSPR